MSNYLRFSHEPVARTVILDDNTLADMDAGGVLVGIETLGPPGTGVAAVALAAAVLDLPRELAGPARLLLSGALSLEGFLAVAEVWYAAGRDVRMFDRETVAIIAALCSGQPAPPRTWTRANSPGGRSPSA